MPGNPTLTKGTAWGNLTETMSTKRLILISCALVSLAPAAETERAFTSTEGDKVQATFVSLDDGIATLLRPDGKSFATPLALLIEKDRQYIEEADRRQKKILEESGKINVAAGMEITGVEPFDRLDAETLAQTLGARPESTSKYGKSWRLYAPKDYRLFGARPYSVALYSDGDGRVTGISAVYANKGDYGSTAGYAEDHFKSSGISAPKSLEEAMEVDDKAITAALTSAIGESTMERYGESGTRRRINRWDWNGYSFLLSNEENEYVSLAIVSTETADNGGRSERMSDADLKQRLTDSVVRAPNGDVHISEIPMVNQGPKGYCVPATFERVMRTMGIDADMYLLAMVGQSGACGGTSVELLMNNVKSSVSRKGRRIKEESLRRLEVRDVRRNIDKGIPLVWTMHSADAYNKLANENTAGRASGGTAFREAMDAKAAELAKTDKPTENAHACMIIGYNEETDELAVSDSWGPRYELRWVPAEVADWASGGKIFMILP